MPASKWHIPPPLIDPLEQRAIFSAAPSRCVTRDEFAGNADSIKWLDLYRH